MSYLQASMFWKRSILTRTVLGAVGGVAFDLLALKPYDGGSGGCGTVFKLNPASIGYTVLKSYSFNGADGDGLGCPSASHRRRALRDDVLRRQRQRSRGQPIPWFVLGLDR
jgi:hypothetical protein